MSCETRPTDSTGWASSARGLPLLHVLVPEGGLLLALGAWRILRRRAGSR